MSSDRRDVDQQPHFPRMTNQVQFILDDQDDIVVLRNVTIPAKGSRIRIHETLYDVREVVVVYSSVAGIDMFVDVHLSRHQEAHP
jgi:hypothetical protein